MILRTYACEACNHLLEVELRSDQWDAPPPDCPHCSTATHQEFRPVAIGGSNHARAAALAEDIAHNDYHVADMQVSAKGIGEVPKVRYKDATPAQLPSASWGANQEMLEGAVAIGRQTRLKHGSGLDVLAHGLKTGAIPDLIEVSKRRSIRVG